MPDRVLICLPDGRWLAYASDESGQFHVFVRPFPEGAKGGGQVQISTVAGRSPRWSRTAKEILYETLDGHIMAVPYTVNERSLDAGNPRAWSAAQIAPIPLFDLWDLAPDGKRAVGFFRSDGGEQKTNLHLTFILNFFDYLKERVPVR